MSDIRTSRRFPVHLPLKVLGEQGTPVGSTENISAAGSISGSMAAWKLAPPLNSRLRFRANRVATGKMFACTARVAWYAATRTRSRAAPALPASSNGTRFCAATSAKPETNRC